jgi:hypothetical protein
MLNSHPDWLRNLSDRSVAAAERFSGHAEQYLAMAQIMLSRGESNFGSTQAVLSRAQARLGEVQANLARHQAETIRIESADMRLITMPSMPKVRVACPRIVVQVAQR